MRFSLPGENDWREGVLSLENNTLYFKIKYGGRDMDRDRSSKVLPLVRIRLPVPWKPGKKRESDYSIPVSSIGDILMEDGILRIKHAPAQSHSTSTSNSHSRPSAELVEVKLGGDEDVLRDVERVLLLKLDAYQFSVYFTHAGEGGVLSLDKNIQLERGLLKISNFALWIIGRESIKRIGWDEIVNVEEKKRSIYKGTEYGAISIDYFGEKDNRIVTSIVIARGNTMDLLKQHVSELLSVYRVDEKLSDAENQILTMMYAGALNLSPEAFTTTAEAFGMDESDLKKHLMHLRELGMVDESMRELTRKGIKYVVDLSKDGTFGG